EIKATFSVSDSLTYNFLVSSDGTAYEASPSTPNYPL
ncbi:jg1171, partial [Pararge aegeria aegeria]